MYIYIEEFLKWILVLQGYLLKKSKYIDSKFKVIIQYLWSRTENLRLQSQ